MSNKALPVQRTKEELFSIAQEMIGLIHDNTLIALEAEAALESANNLLDQLNLRNKAFDGGKCFRTIQNSLALNLSMSLARLFEEPGRRFHPDHSDIASIPLLVATLEKPECREILLATAEKWTPYIADMEKIHVGVCTKAIDNVIQKYQELKDSKEGTEALAALSHFRTMRLAHSLHGKELEAVPKYKDLFLLMDFARQIALHAKLAINGEHHDLGDAETEYYREANAFWEPALNGIKGLIEDSCVKDNE